MQFFFLRRVFLLSSLRYTVDIYTGNLFFNVHIKPHTDYASVVSDGRRDVLKNEKEFSAVKVILPDKTLIIDQKLKQMRLIVRPNTKNRKRTRDCSRRGSLTMRPQSIYIYRIGCHTHPHAVPTLGTVILVLLGHG